MTTRGPSLSFSRAKVLPLIQAVLNHAAKAATASHRGECTLHGKMVLLRGSRAWDLAKEGRPKGGRRHAHVHDEIVLEFSAFECRLANNTPWTTPRTILIDPHLSIVCIEGVGGCGWWFGSGKGSRICPAKEKTASRWAL